MRRLLPVVTASLCSGLVLLGAAGTAFAAPDVPYRPFVQKTAAERMAEVQPMPKPMRGLAFRDSQLRSARLSSKGNAIGQLPVWQTKANRIEDDIALSDTAAGGPPVVAVGGLLLTLLPIGRLEFVNLPELIQALPPG